MKTKVLYTSNVLLREIEPKEYRSAVGQLVPRLGSSLNGNLKWAVEFIEELDRHKCWEWFRLDRTTFYKRHASLAADRIDDIKAEVGRLIQLGRPVPSDVRELGQHGGDRKSKAARNQVRDDTNLIHSSDTALYIVARLDRYRPDLAARVRAHELSANAAAIEAGWRKKRVYKKLSALDQILKLLPKLTDEEQDIVSERLKEMHHARPDELRFHQPDAGTSAADHRGCHAARGRERRRGLEGYV